MTTEQTPPRRPIKQGLLGFTLTFVVMVTLLTTQFILNYSDDIFGKQLDNFVIIKFLSLVLLSLVTLSLPISILVMTTIYYRQLFRNGQTEINFKSTLLPSTAILSVSFIWIAFISPINNLHMNRLLFDIRITRPNEKMEPTDLNLFKNSSMTSSFFQLGHAIDSLKTATPYTSEIENALFRQNGEREALKFQIERVKMVGVPLLTFILFYSGMFLGILNRQSKLIYILISIYLTVLPGIYYLQIYFEKLAKQSTVTAFQGQLFYLSIMATLTIGLFFYAKRQMRNA